MCPQQDTDPWMAPCSGVYGVWMQHDCRSLWIKALATWRVMWWCRVKAFWGRRTRKGPLERRGIVFRINRVWIIFFKSAGGTMACQCQSDMPLFSAPLWQWFHTQEPSSGSWVGNQGLPDNPLCSLSTLNKNIALKKKSRYVWKLIWWGCRQKCFIHVWCWQLKVTGIVRHSRPNAMS